MIAFSDGRDAAEVYAKAKTHVEIAHDKEYWFLCWQGCANAQQPNDAEGEQAIRQRARELFHNGNKPAILTERMNATDDCTTEGRWTVLDYQTA